MFFFPGILIAKKPIFRRLNTCEPDGFFASSEHEKVSAFESYVGYKQIHFCPVSNVKLLNKLMLFFGGARRLVCFYLISV